MSAYQDASVEYDQLKIKICDFFHLGAFGCFLTTMTELTKLKSHPKVIIDFCFDNLRRHYLYYTKIFISSKITHRNICLLLLVIPIQLIGVESYCYHHKYLLVSL